MLFRDQRLPCTLPRSSGLSLALPGLTVQVVRSGVVESDLFLGLVVGFEKRFVNSLLVASKTSNGLVVGKLGQLEQHSIEDGGLGFLIGVEKELLLLAFLGLFLEEDVARRIYNKNLSVLSDNALLGGLRPNPRPTAQC